MSRAIARKAAMQMIYEQTAGGGGGEDTLQLAYDEMRQEGLSPIQKDDPGVAERAWIDRVVHGVLDHREEIDREIARYSTWPLERMALVDLTILRMAVWELRYANDPDVPGKVAIAAAVEMAKVYSEPDSGRFVNGILGSIFRSAEAET